MIQNCYMCAVWKCHFADAGNALFILMPLNVKNLWDHLTNLYVEIGFYYTIFTKLLLKVNFYGWVTLLLPSDMQTFLNGCQVTGYTID